MDRATKHNGSSQPDCDARMNYFDYKWRQENQLGDEVTPEMGKGTRVGRLNKVGLVS